MVRFLRLACISPRVHPFYYQFLEESVIGEEVLDDIKDEDELQCDFEDLNEKPILNLNDVKVNLINEKTRYS